MGEGQSQAEFIRVMTDFVANIHTLNQMHTNGDEKEQSTIKDKWKYELDIVASLDKSETNNATVLDFFNSFYAKISAFNNSGAIPLIKLYKAMSTKSK